MDWRYGGKWAGGSGESVRSSFGGKGFPVCEGAHRGRG